MLTGALHLIKPASERCARQRSGGPCGLDILTLSSYPERIEPPSCARTMMWCAACLLLVFSAEPEPKRLEPGELPALWDDLIATDASKAFKAICRLGMAPDVSVPFLRVQLKPVERVEA